MVLKEGEIIHAITRSLFKDDARRHFAGRVIEASEQAVRARGYLFVYNAVAGEFVRRRHQRVYIIPIGDSGTIVNVLPDDVDLENLTYEAEAEADDFVLTDRKDLRYSFSEFLWKTYEKS
jgi:hypothetical protein